MRPSLQHGFQNGGRSNISGALCVAEVGNLKLAFNAIKCWDTIFS